MKRLLLVGVGALMLSACGSGGGGAAVSANSADSTEITAVGTIIGTVNGAANSTVPADNMTTGNLVVAEADNAAISQGVANDSADGNTSGQ